MSSENKNKFARANRLVSLGTLLLVSLVLYNNCGMRERTNDLAFLSVDEFQSQHLDGLRKSYDPSYCDDADSFSCMKKTFSPDVTDGSEFVEFPCLQISDSVELCADGQHYLYNSLSAMESCTDCTNEEIVQRYIFEEFLCYHNGIKVQGVHPVRFESRNFEEALKGAHNSCKKMLGGQ